MNDLYFISLVLENYELYLLIAICIAPIYIFIYNKKLVGIFDLIAYQLIGSLFAASTVIFLFLNYEINLKYIFSFFSTEITFLCGFFLLSPDKSKIYSKLKDIEIPRNFHNKNFLLLVIAFIIFTALKITQYYLVGVPIFFYNRLGMAESGLGYFQTFSFGLIPLICYRIVLEYNNSRSSKGWCQFFVLILLIFSILDGSKAGALLLVQILYLATILIYGIYNIKISYIKIIILFSFIIIPIIVSILFKFDDLEDGFLSILTRFVGFGDIFYLGYSDGIIDLADKNINFYHLIVYPFLQTIKIVQPNDQFFSIGEFVNQSANNSFEGGGPNSRINIVSYILFGNFGFLFSFIIGLFIGYIRRSILIKSSNLNYRLILFAIIVSIPSMWTDISLGISVFTIFLSVMIIWLFFEFIIKKIF